MALTQIANVKELQPMTYQPLVLVEITMFNGQVLRFSSHMLSQTAWGGGGFQYAGNDYIPNILNQDQALQVLLSDQGVDSVPQMSIKMADPGREIYTNFELGVGFRGATMVGRLIFMDMLTGDYTPDSLVRFTGTCATPDCPDEKTLSLTAIGNLGMTQSQLPSIRIQQTCPWSFPSTRAQRNDGAFNVDSPYFECGHSPELNFGNFQATTTLSAACGLNDATITLASTTGFPTVGTSISNSQYAVDVVDGSGNYETMFVTSAPSSGGVVSVVRAAQGTSTRAFSSGATVNVPYTVCGYARPDCMARNGNSGNSSFSPDGDITHDQSGRASGTFGGIQYQPAATYTSRSYISGKWEDIINDDNEAKYGDLVPLNYGTTWVDAIVLNVVGDGNYTKCEVLVGYGEHGYVYDVIVNGFKLPHGGTDSLGPGELQNNNLGGGAWYTVTSGTRNGALNADALYDKHGDCYGSMCVLEIIVPIKVGAANAAPSVQVRVDGPKIRTYSSPTSPVHQFTDNPAWVIMDLLMWANWRYSQLDIPSFIAAAANFSQQIYFTNQAGQWVNTVPGSQPGSGTVPYAKWAVSLSVRSRTSATSAIQSLRNACVSIVSINPESGLLALTPKTTLGYQQPSPVQLNGVNASNYNSAVDTIDEAGDDASGYVAYWFNEHTIANDKDGNSTFKILPRGINDAPNTATLQFQDFENRYNPDSLTFVDTEDLARINQQITGQFSAIGANGFDRARRCIGTWMAEGLRGNPRLSYRGETTGDTGGTIKVQLQSSFRAVHLKAGQIVMVSKAQYGIHEEYFRVVGIQPSMNSELLTFTLAWHNDAWYWNQFNQIGAALYKHHQGNLQRIPFAWGPYLEQPPAGDSMYARTDWSFRLSQTYQLAADGSNIPYANMVGCAPISLASSYPAPPLVVLQATTTNTGGTIPGGSTYFIQVCSKNVAGSSYSPSWPSFTQAVAYPASGSANTITVDVPFWDPLAAGYVVFAGTHPQKLTYQGSADFTGLGLGPSTITLTSFNVDAWGVPDQEFDHLRMYFKRVMVPGCCMLQVTGSYPGDKSFVTSTSIAYLPLNGPTYDGSVFLGFNFVGYDVSVYSLVGNDEETVSNNGPVPIFNATIASLTFPGGVPTMTFAAGLDGNVPNPTIVPRGDGTTGLSKGDVLVIRSKPTVGSDSTGNYLEDLGMVNGFNPLDGKSLQIDAVANNSGNAQLTMDVPHGYSVGNRVYVLNAFIGRDAVYTILTVDSSTKFTLNTSAVSYSTLMYVPYTGTAGTTQLQLSAMLANTMAGNLVRCLTGPGKDQVATVTQNTDTRLYIGGPWPHGTPTSNTRYVVEEPTWFPVVDSGPSNNSNPTALITLSAQMNNWSLQPMLFKGVCVDSGDLEALDYDSPTRDVLIIGYSGVSNGKLLIPVPGVLAIGSDLGQIAFFDAQTTPKQAYLAVKNAPVGAALQVRIYCQSGTICTLTIPAGSTSVASTPTDMANTPIVAVYAHIKVDILTCGTTYPGSDLTVGVFG